MNQTKINTLLAQIRNVAWRSKQRLTKENTIHFNRLFVFRLTGCLRIAILTDRITTGTLCQHGRKWYPISGSRTSKIIRYPAAHSYIAHIWEYPLPRALQSSLGEKWTISCMQNTKIVIDTSQDMPVSFFSKIPVHNSPSSSKPGAIIGDSIPDYGSYPNCIFRDLWNWESYFPPSQAFCSCKGHQWPVWKITEMSGLLPPPPPNPSLPFSF